MKVVLLQDVPKVGRKGEVKNVADGFARNALIPQKKAMPATDVAIKRAQMFKKNAEEAVVAERSALAACAALFAVEPLSIIHAANEDGTLFAAVSADELAAALSARCNISVDADRDIGIAAPIKTLGDHTVTLGGMNIHIAVAEK